MGSSCSSGQCKDKDSKKSSKKGKHGKDKSPRGSNASNSSIHPYQKATGDGGGQTKSDEGQLQVPPTVAAATSLEASAQHPPAERLDSQPLSPISPTLLEQSPKDSGLPDFLAFPEIVRPVIVGNVTEPMVISKPNKIVLFVCGDFEDSVAEREALQTNLHLLLRQKCFERGFELLLYDLHQGLSRSSFLDHDLRTKAVAELKNISKNNYCIPLVILNDTLGPVLPPKQILKEDWDELCSTLTEESEKDFLNQWYILNENTEPVSYTLQPVHIIHPNVQNSDLNERQEAETLWMKDEQQLTDILKKNSNGKFEKYLTTYLEDLVMELIDNEDHVVKQCIWISRSYSDKPADEAESKAVGMLKDKLLGHMEDTWILKFTVPWIDNQINPSENPQHAEYIEELTKELQDVIISKINFVMDQADTESLKEYLGMNKHLFRELIQQGKFCKRQVETFTGQEQILAKVEEYIRGTKTTPLILHGTPGSGKTALIAKAVEQCSEWKEGAPVIFRFVGLTPRSATMEQLVCSMCEQCCILFGEHPSLAYQSISELTKQFPVLLEKVSPFRPLIVILDGLDQIADYGSQSMEWVLKILPDQVKLILSVRDGSEQLSQLKEMIPDEECYVSVANASSEDIFKIINNILSKSNRTITENQKDKINSAIGDNSTPLSAVLLSIKASAWNSNEDSFNLTAEPQKLIENVLEDLEKSFGKNNISRILVYLITAKHGVTESEILDLLSSDETLKSETRFPLYLWFLLKNTLSSFLNVINIDKVSVTNCVSGSIKEIVQARYIPENNLSEISQLYVKYYLDNLSDDEKSTYAIPNQTVHCGNVYNKRKLEELPFHVYRTGGDLIEEYLFNTDWLFAKLCGSNVYSVIEDINLIKESNSDLLLLKEMLQLSSYALSCDGLQIYSQIVARLPPLDEANYPLMTKLIQFASSAPISSLLPKERCLLAPSSVRNNIPSETADEDETVYFNSLHRFKNNATHIISLSAEHNEVIVWNIYDQTAVRKLKGVLLPRNIKMVDEFRAVVLSNRELKVYNLDSGSFEVKIQGVMNQKMPFYGLHDENHVVALSRNRMYVNMANMETNQCVASFKVGEDRFLNSLLVSANGEICVCGDETQKPFPLLVWDLNSRKLLYDLRIPHHEFITNLSAITSDGHYVVIVCKEVEYTSPNFIVVYDLQNGTMFKKWKPDVNVCSIAISAEGGCVVSGIENANILVWDLTTGACRFSLAGHSSPVDVIQLDDSGFISLSYDSTGRDHSIRVWNTKNGESLAVFTPDKPVICCELSSDGRAVVLGTSGCQHVITLILCNQCSVSDNIPEVPLFGNAENAGKEVDLTGLG